MKAEGGRIDVVVQYTYTHTNTRTVWKAIRLAVDGEDGANNIAQRNHVAIRAVDGVEHGCVCLCRGKIVRVSMSECGRLYCV